MLMSSIAAAAHELPESKQASRGPKQWLADLQALLSAVSAGLDASYDYKLLTAHGVQPSDAANRVFGRHLAKQ